MQVGVYIDPEIDMNTKAFVTIIIHFKTRPARTAVEMGKASGKPISLEEAKQAVEDSHRRFKEDLKLYFDSDKIPYKITHTYKMAINGVAMELPGMEVKRLLKSKEIEGIYANKEYHLDPPPQLLS